MRSTKSRFHSTEAAFLKIQNDILQSLDKNDATILVMLDLSAAFDTTDHETHIRRSERHFGNAGKPLAWLTSYLSDRYQIACTNGELSKPVHIK